MHLLMPFCRLTVCCVHCQHDIVHARLDEKEQKRKDQQLQALPARERRYRRQPNIHHLPLPPTTRDPELTECR